MTGDFFESMMIKRKEPLVAHCHVLGFFEMIRWYAHEMYYIITSRVFQIPCEQVLCFVFGGPNDMPLHKVFDKVLEIS